MFTLVADYIEYLEQLNENLNRKGIETNVKLSEMSLEEDVNKLEQYMYFNEVLIKCDSSYKITDVLGYRQKELNDFLREKFYEDYNEEWLKRSENIIVQPKDAGDYSKTQVRVVSPLEVKVFTESLNLDSAPVITKVERTVQEPIEPVESEFIETEEKPIKTKSESKAPKTLAALNFDFDMQLAHKSLARSKVDKELDTLSLDDEDVDIDYTDKEPKLSEINLDFGTDEEEEEEELEYDEYSDEEIADLLKETDEELEDEEIKALKPKEIDYKSRITTIEADKIVELVNKGMNALFAAIC